MLAAAAGRKMDLPYRRREVLGMHTAIVRSREVALAGLLLLLPPGRAPPRLHHASTATDTEVGG